MGLLRCGSSEGRRIRLVCAGDAREYKVPFQEIERIADLEIGGLAGVIALRKRGDERFLYSEDGVGLEIGIPLDKEMCRHALVAGSSNDEMNVGGAHLRATHRGQNFADGTVGWNRVRRGFDRSEPESAVFAGPED